MSESLRDLCFRVNKEDFFSNNDDCVCQDLLYNNVRMLSNSLAAVGLHALLILEKYHNTLPFKKKRCKTTFY